MVFIIINIYLFTFKDSFFKIFFSYFLSYTYNIKNIQNYYRLCNSQRLINKRKYKKNKFPKVSIISPIYNREKYILRFLRSLQNQKFNDIEILLIDDCSNDKSVKKIEQYQEKDERIVLIKNKKNKGTLMSRIIGVFNSRGEYLIFPDPDDIP